MPRNLPRVVLAGHTRADRQKARQGIQLRDFTITAATKHRYLTAVTKLLPYLEASPQLDDIDSVLCEYIEAQWARGESLNMIADGLSGLHFFWPELRGTLRNAWRMFKSWRRVEAPCRAPPMTIQIARALVALAVEREDISFAAMIVLGYHALLRTGELLELQFQDLELSLECGVVSLKGSKSGIRMGSEEAVALRDSLTLQVLDTLVALRDPWPGDRLWPHAPQTFRKVFASYMARLGIESLALKPYSMRRGGATFLLQCGLPMEAILVRGRWKSLSVARLYLQDGLAQVPALRLPVDLADRLASLARATPSTAFRP